MNEEYKSEEENSSLEKLKSIDLNMPICYDEPYCNYDKESFSEEKDSKLEAILNDKRVQLAKKVVQAAATKSVTITKSF